MVLSLLLGAWTYHFDRNNQNESNDLIGIQSDKTVVATFVNSRYRRSYVFDYEFVSYDLNDSGSLKLSGEAGFVSGYNSKAVSDYKPFIFPVVSYQFTEQLKTNMILSPKMVGINFEWKFQ